MGQLGFPLVQPRAPGRPATMFSSRRRAMPTFFRTGFAGAKPRRRPQTFCLSHSALKDAGADCPTGMPFHPGLPRAA
jgi:hypothetical protein